MFLLVRCILTNMSRLVVMGKRITRNTYDPKLATLSATYLLVPSIMDTTTIRVETDRITPSSVRKERSLWARRVSSAIIIGSFSEILRRGLIGVCIGLKRMLLESNLSLRERRKSRQKVPYSGNKNALCWTHPKPHSFDDSCPLIENRNSTTVGLWRSWERASMAWKRSSVRSRPGPPILPASL